MTGYTQGKHLLQFLAHSGYVWEASSHRHEFATKRPLVAVESRGGWADVRKGPTWGESLTLL